MGKIRIPKDKYIELIKLRMQAKYKMLSGDIKILRKFKKELIRSHAK